MLLRRHTIVLALAGIGCKSAAPQPGTDPSPQPAASIPASEATATLDVGSMIAPDFTLAAADGKVVRLADAVAQGPVVVVFYRGDW